MRDVPADRIEEGVGGCRDSGIDSLNSRGLWLDLGPDCNRAIASPPRAFSTLAGNKGLANSRGSVDSSTSLRALGFGLGYDTISGEASGGEASSKKASNPFADSVDGGAYAGCCGCEGVDKTSQLRCSLRLCLVIESWHVRLQ